MTHRERVLRALNHTEPDRVPLFYRDVPEVEQRLLKDLSLRDREELLRFFDIDFRWVGPQYVGPPLSDKKTGRRRDIWGVEYQFTRFSEQAGYWEAVVHPLADCTAPEALDDYSWPELEWFDFSALRDQVGRYDDYAIMTAPDFSSPGILQTPVQSLVGVEKSLIDITLNPEFFSALVRRILDFIEPFVDRMLEAAGGRIDLFRVGDDFGTQRGLLIGPAQWREFVQPGLRSLAEIANRHGAHVYLHSCGSVRDLIPNLIATGVEVLDPVQVQAAGMVPSELKLEYGDILCFSGGVDEQRLLPRGTPAEVKSGVSRLLDTMAPGGGFFVGPTHNLQDDIPTANIVAMYEAAREWEY